MNNLFLCEYLGVQPRSSIVLDLLDRICRKTVPWLRIGSSWRGRMASVESRMNQYYLLTRVIAQCVPGDIVEIGCNAGESSVILQRIIKDWGNSAELHVYDSFQGVPQGDSADEGAYKPGDMAATEVQLHDNFDRLRLKRPVVHRGWFEKTLPDSLPKQIAFAMLDADLYRSTLHALESVYPRLSPGAICLLGVYWDPMTKMGMTTDMKYKSPGVKKACDEFLLDKPERINILLAGNYTSGYFSRQNSNACSAHTAP